LSARRTVAVEALLRWNHPRWGTLSPTVFLPVAEEAGLTDAISGLILRDTCAQAVRWREEFADPPLLTVNVSRLQLNSPDFAGLVVGALDAAALPHRALILEVPEQEFELVDEAGMKSLRDLGAAEVGLCLDDYRADLGYEPGLGWNSVVLLKTSRDFVREVVRHRRRGAALKALMTFGDALGLPVVVKGVETPPQLDWLAAHCPSALVQGYAVSAVLSAEQATVWLQRGTMSRP
jgi:EAL domain-containing protein (putative c-di-GMP-specific phosphodiesterase class I)